MAVRVSIPSVSRIKNRRISDLFCAYKTLQEFGIDFDKSFLQKHAISEEGHSKKVSATIKKKQKELLLQLGRAALNLPSLVGNTSELKKLLGQDATIMYLM